MAIDSRISWVLHFDDGVREVIDAWYSWISTHALADWISFTCGIGVSDGSVGPWWQTVFGGDTVRREYPVQGAADQSLYPLHQSIAGSVTASYVVDCPADTETGAVLMAATTSSWSSNILALVRSWFTGQCGATQLGTITSTNSDPDETWYQYLWSWHGARGPAAASLSKSIVLRRPVDKQVPSTKVLAPTPIVGQGYQQSSQGVGQLAGQWWLSQIVQALKDIAGADVDISLNYGNHIFSVRSKEVTSP